MILQETDTKTIVNRLREELHPMAIYLFGSQSSGKADAADSDVDLFIVVPDDGEDSYRKTVRAYRSLRDLGFPKDILVRHESRFHERSAWQNSVESQVVQTGQLLYRSDETRV